MSRSGPDPAILRFRPSAAAGRTFRISREPKGARRSSKPVIDKKATLERSACPGQQLDGFEGRHRSDNARDRADDADPRAGLRIRWGGGNQTAIAGLTDKHADLTAPSSERPRHEGDAKSQTGVADGEPGGEVVGPVDHQIAAAQQPLCIFRVQPLKPWFDLNMRIEQAEFRRTGLDLGSSDGVRVEDDLALKVRQGDMVIIDQSQRSDARSRQIEGGGRPDPAEAHQPHPRRLQTLLPRPADLGQHQLTRVALDFFVCELHRLRIGAAEPKVTYGA
jgi:hypothetical protein